MLWSLHWILRQFFWEGEAPAEPRTNGHRKRKVFMAERNRYRDHMDPAYRKWGLAYRSFPGVEECVRLILARKAKGAWADIVVHELAENASENLQPLIGAFRKSKSDDVAVFVLMALELAALPASVEFLSEVLQNENPEFVAYARRTLIAIDTAESRSALFHAGGREFPKRTGRQCEDGASEI